MKVKSSQDDDSLKQMLIASLLGSVGGTTLGSLGVLRDGPFMHRTARGTMQGGLAGILGYLGGALGNKLGDRLGTIPKGTFTPKRLRWLNGADIAPLLGIALGAGSGVYLGDLLGDKVGLQAYEDEDEYE